MSSTQRTFHASCHCQSSKLSFTVLTDCLPLPTHFCHCSICRRTHGTLCTIHTPIPKPAVDLTTFTAYRSSENAVRYFCSTCGAHMLDKARGNTDEEDGQWYVATSLVDAEEDCWRFTEHSNLENTRDGGLSVWLSHVNGRRLRCWKEKPRKEKKDSDSGDWEPLTEAQSPSVATTGSAGNKLHASCHCGGVQFYVARPDESSFENMPPTLTPRDKSKWYALLDVCDSCRLCSSSFATPWVFPSLSSITLPDGSPYTPMSGAAKSYSSSPGIQRTFCGTCGALVSYQCDDRPQMIDIGVGLLNAPSGVRAEEWLEWRTAKVGYEEDCRWKGVLQSLKTSLQEHSRPG